MSKYRIRIINTVSGEEVDLYPGAQGERDLIDSVVAETLSQGVGVLRTEVQVERKLRAAFDAVLRDLKSEVRPN